MVKGEAANAGQTGQGMTYPQGYSSEPAMGYPPERAASPVTAVLAGAFALATAGALLVETVHVASGFAEIGIRNIPVNVLGILVGRFLAGLFLLVGACLIFARKDIGPILAIVGAPWGVASVLLEPLIIRVPLDVYLDVLFSFEQLKAVLLAFALMSAPVALLFTLLPATGRWVRGGGPRPGR